MKEARDETQERNVGDNVDAIYLSWDDLALGQI
jgi:hypothetical protein